LDLSKFPGFLTAHEYSKSVKLITNIEGFDVNIELKSEYSAVNSNGLTKAGLEKLIKASGISSRNGQKKKTTYPV